MSSNTRTRCKKLIRSYGWKALMILFYTFMLFGHPLCRIFSVEALVSDVLAALAFLFCVIEMGLHALAEPQYIQYEPASLGANKSLINGGSYSIKFCTVGSFLFWCDLVSTGVVLYHISWINKEHVRLKTFELSLNTYGFPVSRVLDISFSRQLFGNSASSRFHSLADNNSMRDLMRGVTSDQGGSNSSCWSLSRDVPELRDLFNRGRWDMLVTFSTVTGC